MSPHHTLRVSILRASAALAVLVAASAAAAQGTGASTAAAMQASGGASLAAGDSAFVQKAAVGGMAEVEMGKLAQQKGSSDQVKEFGSRMVDDHSKANDDLKKIANAKGIALPNDLDAKHKNKMARMQKLSGAQFDRAYMDDMVADHKQDIADFRKEATSGKDGDLKAFAAKTLPTLEDHLKMAQSTDAVVKGVKMPAGR